MFQVRDLRLRSQNARVRFEIEDEDLVLETLRPHESPMIIANHRSWFDIFALQTLICRRGPMLKFLIKTELLWVPVLGWVCVALNFPRLQRKGDRRTRTRDLGIVQKASLQLGASPGALLLFPEGTRSLWKQQKGAWRCAKL